MTTKYLAALLAAAAAATATATSAAAQDSNFSGIRAEARIGWDRTNADAAIPDPDDADETVAVDGNDDALSYGVELGYDAQFDGGFLIGAYAGVDFGDAELCRELAGDDLGCVESGRNITAGVRVGFGLGENILLYAKGGYSNGRLSFDYDGDIEDDDNDLFAFRRTRDGYHLGAGLEVALNRNLYVKGEYVYTDYGRLNYVDAEDEDLTASVGADRHQALLGIGLRF